MVDFSRGEIHYERTLLIMSDTKKYYYMRLKEDFFDSDEMKVLESMQDGYLYSNILLKMYLSSLKNEGKLMLNNVIPYNAQMIATITRHQVGTVEKALDIFSKLGLIEVLNDGAIYMLNIQNFIGKASTEADRIRKYQRRIADEKAKEEQGVEIYKKSTPEIEIEKKLELKKEKKKEEVKHRYGEYKHVLLKDSEYKRLVADYGEQAVLDGIKNVDEYIQMRGDKYKDHNLVMRKWGIKSPKLPKPKTQKKQNKVKDKAVVLLDDESNMMEYEADIAKHPYEEGWRTDNGYWIKRG